MPRLHHTLCEPPTLGSYTFLLSLILQSALLHPSFSSNLGARLTRLALVIPNVYWSLRFPFRNCYTPLALQGDANMGLAAIGIYYSMKAIEWGCVSGPYFFRPLKNINGIKQWIRTTDDQNSVKLSEARDQDAQPGLIRWTLLHFLS